MQGPEDVIPILVGHKQQNNILCPCNPGQPAESAKRVCYIIIAHMTKIIEFRQNSV